MMRNPRRFIGIIPVLLVLALAQTAFAAAPDWAFVKGSGDYVEEYGVYNDPNPANNHPGSRYGAVSWSDPSGNFWLFGGYGFGGSGSGYLSLNDLWKFDPVSGNWTFVKGSGDYLDEYGVYNDPNPANNHPGSRSRAVTWTDSSGNLWLFGGYGFAASGVGYLALNDLWKFDPVSGNWTFVKGSGDYLSEMGDYYDPNPASILPSSRADAVSWTDNSGNLWLFGGHFFSVDLEASVILNDLWKFDPSSGNWTFVKGADDYFPEYGVYNHPNPANNHPGSRYGAVSWSDPSGNLWLFGGDGYAASYPGYLNDLWKFDPVSGNWTFVKGSGDYRNQPSVNTHPNPANHFPSSRAYATSWTDAAGALWLFGGDGYGGPETDHNNLNDLWKFDPINGRWMYVKGGKPSSLDALGLYDAPVAADRIPGSRRGAVSWADGSGGLWLFGGFGRGASAAITGASLNDLWKFEVPAPTAPLLVVRGAGSGDGVVSGAVLPAATYEINCSITAGNSSGNCMDVSDAGTAYFVTAYADVDSSFVGWTGCDSTSGANSQHCHITLNATSTITAYFISDTSSFADMPVAGKAWMQDWVETFYAAGITGGCEANPLNYCPEREVTRAEMAVFVIRALNFPNLPYTPTDPDDSFADVPVAGKVWMQPWIEEFYDLGITQGCGVDPLIFCPEQPVTRAEMAVFILRALEGGSYTPPAASGYFSDVPVASKEWMESWIDEFYRRGITGGCATSPSLQFCPEREVTRAEMAVFIIRAFDSLPTP